MLDTLARVNVARPRLLAGSLAVALVVILGFTLFMVSTADDGDSAGDADATLSDPLDRTPPAPGDQLGNTDVEGDPFPDATLSDRDGNRFSSLELVGEPMVVNFWFSTCPPCAKELPDFAEVHQERGDDVRFVGVNTIDSVEVMERFAGERGVQYELYRDEFAELTDGIGAAAFPVTIFVTSDGAILEQKGVLDADELREEIDKLQAAEGTA